MGARIIGRFTTAMLQCDECGTVEHLQIPSVVYDLNSLKTVDELHLGGWTSDEGGIRWYCLAHAKIQDELAELEPGDYIATNHSGRGVTVSIYRHPIKGLMVAMDDDDGGDQPIGILRGYPLKKATDGGNE